MTEIYVDQMFNDTTAGSQASRTMNVGTTATAGTYSPKAAGTLVKVGIFCTPQAVTSTCYAGFVVLTCTLWTPINTSTFSFTGFGVNTAPMAQNQPPFEFVVNLPVSPAVAITGTDTQTWPATTITPNLIVYGVFTA